MGNPLVARSDSFEGATLGPSNPPPQESSRVIQAANPGATHSDHTALWGGAFEKSLFNWRWKITACLTAIIFCIFLGLLIHSSISSRH